ncbi:MAG: glycosyltransferase [Frankia sp.]|nr:glycosyltransferase [Frankia sp.]
MTFTVSAEVAVTNIPRQSTGNAIEAGAAGAEAAGTDGADSPGSAASGGRAALPAAGSAPPAIDSPAPAAAEGPARPVAGSSARPTARGAARPAAGNRARPATEPPSGPTTGHPAGPTVDHPAGPAAERPAGSAAERAAGSAAERAAGSATEHAAGPAAGPAAEGRAGRDPGGPARAASGEPRGDSDQPASRPRAEPGLAAPWDGATVRVGWHPTDPTSVAAVAEPVAAVAVIVAGACYLAWRLRTIGDAGAAGALCLAAEVAAYLLLAGLAAGAARANRGFARRPPAPAGTLDVFVVAGGEPLAAIDRSLIAAKGITYPHRTFLLHDGRLAGGRSAQTAESLALRHDAVCLARSRGPAGRAALLNDALTRTDGDAVLVLDAGDVVSPDAGHQLLGYLRDPHVGLVTSVPRAEPGSANAVADRVAPAVARLAAAARDRDGAAFADASSGTLYRRAAIETVDGFSPRGAAEEPRTSYELLAAGWHSVFHPVPVATRAARPAAVAAGMLTDRAADRLRILLFDNPLRKAGLTGRQRAHLLLDTLTPLLLVAQVGVWAVPPLVVFGGAWPGGGADVGAWLGFGLPYLLTAALFLTAVAGTELAGRGPRPAARARRPRPTGGRLAGGLLGMVASWLLAIPVSVMALGLVFVRGGRSGPWWAPGRARHVARRLRHRSRPHGYRGWRGRPGRSGSLLPAGLTRVSLLPLWLAVTGLAAAVVGGFVRLDAALAGPLLWAGVVLLVVAGPVAAAAAAPGAAPRAAGLARARVALAAVVALAACLSLALG